MLDLSRCMTAGRRLRGEPWMRLVATVAHPRQWDLLEKDLAELVKRLFHNDPPELTRLLAPIGRDLAVPGWSVVTQNQAQAGLLHLFANDWRQTDSNNSGGVQLRITRLATPDSGVPAGRCGCAADGAGRRAERGSGSGRTESSIQLKSWKMVLPLVGLHPMLSGFPASFASWRG